MIWIKSYWRAPGYLHSTGYKQVEIVVDAIIKSIDLGFNKNQII